VHLHRIRLSASACLIALTAAALTAAPAEAAPSSPHVRVSGQISCATWPPALPSTSYLASRARFQTSTGEARNASISGLSYSVDLNNVPANGTTVTVYVTCKNFRNPSWGKSFRVSRQTNQQQSVNLLYH
jgi:hypothetical protein